MHSIRKRLTYANVASSLALFLVLGGATAIAAHHLGKRTVGSAQLKNNAVTRAKIRKNAVIGSKIADGSITGRDVNASSMPFSRIVHEARGSSSLALPNGAYTDYPLEGNSYSQEAGSDDFYAAALDVTFMSTCTAPRGVYVHVLVDPANPTTPTSNDSVSYGEIADAGSGQVSRRVNVSPLGVQFQSGSPVNHTLYIAAEPHCASGSGVTATFGGIDVIGLK
jgi:hypothetical protein